jgi:hypothetical protein
MQNRNMPQLYVFCIQWVVHTWHDIAGRIVEPHITYEIQQTLNDLYKYI